MRVLLFAAALLIVALPAAGSASPARPGLTRLSIAVWPQGVGVGKPVRTFILRCRPAGGNHPTPATACRRISSNIDALGPLPANRLCLAVSDGPEAATVTGTLSGWRHRSTFSRRNSCESERWYRLAPLFPLPLPTKLEIRIYPDGPSERNFLRTLRCNPAGGTVPDPAKACARLLALPDPFAPICGDTTGRREVAYVEGAFRGWLVQAKFDRTSRCETQRWDRVAFLFVRR
jgi:hypothetical protein